MVNHIYNAETASTFCRDHMGPTAITVSGGTPSCDECIERALGESHEAFKKELDEQVIAPIARQLDGMANARKAFNEWLAEDPDTEHDDTIAERIAGEFKKAGVPRPDPVNLPDHYRKLPVECIDITEHFNFCMGNALKYIWRADHKGNPIQDLEKARWYLQREIERRRELR